MEPATTAGAADSLHLLDVGEGGQPVIMLHPEGTDSRVWDLVVRPMLRGGARVVAYDRRGYGRSGGSPGPFTQLQDLEAVMRRTDVDAAVLVAGGEASRIALEAALQIPDRVAGVVLVCPTMPDAPASTAGPDPHEERLLSAIAELTALGDREGINRYQARLWLDGSMHPQIRVQDPARQLFLTMNARALGAPRPVEEETGTAVWSQVEQVRQRTLVLTGRHDLSAVAEQGHILAERLPDSLRWEFPRSAHLPMLDDPTTFAMILGEFLDLLGWNSSTR